MEGSVCCDYVKVSHIGKSHLPMYGIYSDHLYWPSEWSPVSEVKKTS